MKNIKVLVLLIIISTFDFRAFSQNSVSARLPSGPEGPGTFGAYYADLKFTFSTASK